mmetsp:Transcript_4609/g.10939  ORF Transcript_4609/g.10939 Transcript_4609/m.10939 type:complete len:1495 (-) Transcript_4609:56-4540(-)
MENVVSRSGCDRGFGPAGQWRGYHHVIEHHAHQYPHAPALEDASGVWSYAELATASRRAAAFLIAAGGVTVDTTGSCAPRWEERPTAPQPLAIAVMRSRELFALCLGAWRLGLPVVALSTDMADKVVEETRSRQVLGELKPSMIISDDAAQWPADIPHFSWTSCKEAIHGSVEGIDFEALPHPERVLVYVYTGGTTKASKCVTVTHGMALWEAENYSIVLGPKAGPGDKMLQPSSLYWGAAVFGQLSLGFSVGGCICIGGCPSGCGGAGHALAQMAQDTENFQISVLGMVPSQLRGTWPGGPASAPGSLRLLVMWADKCPTDLSREWSSNRIRVVDLLIASEYWLALHSECEVWFDGTAEKHVYKKLDKLDMRLLVEEEEGAALRDARIGEVGEMYLAGPTTSPGYVCEDGTVSLAQHDAGKIIDNKLYLRTRDKLLLLPDGGLVYSGRADSMLKHGGKWVDADALQDGVMAVPGVVQAAVLAASGVDAFVVLRGRAGLSQGGVQVQAPFRVLAAIRKALPASTTGGCRVHVLSELPLNAATGKVNKRALEEKLKGMQGEKEAHRKLQDDLTHDLVVHYKAWTYAALASVIVPSALISLAKFAFFGCFSDGKLLVIAVRELASFVVAIPLRYFLAAILWSACEYFEDRHESISAKIKSMWKACPLVPGSTYTRWLPVAAAVVLPPNCLCAIGSLAFGWLALQRKCCSALACGCWTAATCAAFSQSLRAMLFREAKRMLPVFSVPHEMAPQVGGALMCGLAGAVLLRPSWLSALVEHVQFVRALPGLFWQIFPKYMSDDLYEDSWEKASGNWLVAFINRTTAKCPPPKWSGHLVFEAEESILDAGNKWSQVKLLNLNDGSEYLNSVGLKVRLEDAARDPLVTELLSKPQPTAAAAASSSSQAAPSGEPARQKSEEELRLESLISRVCGGEGADALHGLDSMQAIQLSEAIRRELGKAIGVSEVLRCSELNDLLEAIQAASAVSASNSANREAALQLAKQREQEEKQRHWRIWLCGLGPRTCTVDWMVQRQDSRQHLDLAAIQRAVDRLVARHAALRTQNASEQPMFDATYLAASLWQLYAAGAEGRRRSWTRSILENIVRRSIFRAWPRSTVLSPDAPEAKVKVLTPTLGDLECCSTADSATQMAFWIGGCCLERRPQGETFHVCVIPVFPVELDFDKEADAVEVALTKPACEVKWFIYAVLDHGYCDGPTGAPLFADLLRLYGEEAGELTKEELERMRESEQGRRPTEALAKLQKRLERSLMPLPEGHHPNEDIFHDGLVSNCWRRGHQRFIRFDETIMKLLRIGATQNLGCSIDVAWLTVISAAFLRTFPKLRRLDLYLVVTCRDGPGEEAMIGYFSSRKLMPLEIGDPAEVSLLGLADSVATARKTRSWRRPGPYEKGSAIEVNMVSQASDGLPLGFQEVRVARGAPREWDRSGTSHMNLRLDQVGRDGWDFRLQSHDQTWGPNWSTYYAQSLGSVLVDIAVKPTGAILPSC